MLELLFAAALMDTVIAHPVGEYVEIHEWGVVTFSQESVVLGADPGTDPHAAAIPPDQWEEPVVRAPVVYFYGKPFSGVFTVNTIAGSFIELYPEPETLTDTSPMPEFPSAIARWRISAAGPHSGERGLPDMDRRAATCVSPELLELWRSPPSMRLEFSDGSAEGFVYYECRLSNWPEQEYYPVTFTHGGPALDPGWDGEVLRCVRAGDSVLLELHSEEGAKEVEPEVVPDMLCRWAGGTMKSQELEAMWETWEDWVMDGEWSGDTLDVFVLPLSTVQNISTVHLETDEYMRVEYRRFFLGMTSR